MSRSILVTYAAAIIGQQVVFGLIPDINLESYMVFLRFSSFPGETTTVI